ncbi:hypothetical protein E2P64_08405 [Candidatus Bathyarchaeota archaeon]|nr:hypothetical protein E2P64_08405 [Candidatus Bathyarchaeota archaeon]
MSQTIGKSVREQYGFMYRFLDKHLPQYVDNIEMPDWWASIEFEIRGEMVSISPDEVRIIHASR